MENCINEYEKMVMRELENVISKGELNPGDVKNLGEAVDIIKDLYTVEAMKHSDAGGYSGGYMRGYPPEMEYSMRGNSNRMYDGNYERRSSYRGGGDYTRGGYARDDGRMMW